MAEGAKWVYNTSKDLCGNRPFPETEALVGKVVDCHAAWVSERDTRPMDRFIEGVTSYRAKSEFHISTLLRGFRSCYRGISAIIDGVVELSEYEKRYVIQEVGSWYEEAIFRMSDVYVGKLNSQIEETQQELLEKEKQRRRDNEQARLAAEIANRAKSEFLANMSHELRTPLNAIIGFTQILAEDESIGREQQNTIKVINQSGDHLLSVVNDVLDMSKIEAGRMEIQFTPTDLKDLCTSVMSLMSSKAKEKGIRLKLITSPNLPRWGLIDEGRLRQVLLNLVGNAIKFTDEGEVALHWRDFGSYREGCHLFLVQDTGCGISPADQKRLFSAFEQVGASPSNCEGTGLGLAISSRIVEMMDGKLAVESQPDKGSVFFFSIPIAETTAPEKKHHNIPSRLSQNPSVSRKILIVDDQPANLMLLSKLLQPLDAQLLQATDGLEAVREFQAHRPDLILMDKRMPRMNGYEAAAVIKSEAGSKAPPIYIVTADALSEEVANQEAEHIDGFITKPFEIDTIREVVLSMT